MKDIPDILAAGGGDLVGTLIFDELQRSMQLVSRRLRELDGDAARLSGGRITCCPER
jgi:hypothetical protein